MRFNRSPQSKSGDRRSKLIIGGLFILSGLVVWVAIRMLIHKNSIDNEIDALEIKISAMETKNTELAGIIDYLNSAEFLRQEGKAKLGLKTNEEKVVVVDTANVNLNNSFDYVNVGNSRPSNLEKWWEYFTK